MPISVVWISSKSSFSCISIADFCILVNGVISYLYATFLFIIMSFLKFILKNPFRRKNSAILAIIGIAIGIVVIVALGGITDGLINTFEDTIHAGGADFSISGKETGDSAYGTNTIDANWTEKIANVSGVSEAYPIYVVLTSVGDDYMNTLIGIDPNGTTLADISMKEGRIMEDNASEAILGEIYAEDNNYSVGDKIKIDGEEFEVVGIYETGDQNMAGGVFTSISKVGELMDDEDSISNIYVKVNKGEDPQTVADRIDEKYGDNITTVTSVMEMTQMADMLNMLQASTWAISLLAIVVGGLGIINTMLMSVFERTREIGVLKAVGWSNRKILTMIVGESLVITIVSAIIGSLIGFLACTLFGPQMGIEPLFTPKIFIQAFAIAIVVGIIGGIYPAIKAVKLPPTEALRYEWGEIMNAVEINDLYKSYEDGKIKALNGVNLTIKDGEFVSIIGPSGSGKSTLLNMLGALDVPDSGSINVAGHDLNSSKKLNEFRAESIGFIFQLHNLIPNISVVENVEIPMFTQKLSSKEMKSKALKLLDDVGLKDKADIKPNKLSGGERQRVAIARALANEPSIILADEPTGSLDSKTSSKILKQLIDLHEDKNVTLIIVTHDMDVAKLADRIIEVLDGEIISAGDDSLINSKIDV